MIAYQINYLHSMLCVILLIYVGKYLFIEINLNSRLRLSNEDSFKTLVLVFLSLKSLDFFSSRHNIFSSLYYDLAFGSEHIVFTIKANNE